MGWVNAPRSVAPIARAALAVLPTVRLEVDTIAAERDRARADLRGARSADDKADLSERAALIAAECAGAERILGLIGRLARGDHPGGPS